MQQPGAEPSRAVRLQLRALPSRWNLRTEAAPGAAGRERPRAERPRAHGACGIFYFFEGGGCKLLERPGKTLPRPAGWPRPRGTESCPVPMGERGTPVRSRGWGRGAGTPHAGEGGRGGGRVGKPHLRVDSPLPKIAREPLGQSLSEGTGGGDGGATGGAPALVGPGLGWQMLRAGPGRAAAFSTENSYKCGAEPCRAVPTPPRPALPRRSRGERRQRRDEPSRAKP